MQVKIFSCGDNYASAYDNSFKIRKAIVDNDLKKAYEVLT